MDATSLKYVAGLSGLLVVILSVALVVTLQQNNQLEQRLDTVSAERQQAISQLETLSERTVMHFEETGVQCTGDETYDGAITCLETVRADRESVPEMNFRLFNDEDNVLVLTNQESREIDGSKFRLYQGDRLVDSDGCAQNTVQAGENCVLEFDSGWDTCEIGQELRATVENTTVYTRTCLS